MEMTARARYMQSAHELSEMLNAKFAAIDAGDEETASRIKAAMDARIDSHRDLFDAMRNSPSAR